MLMEPTHEMITEWERMYNQYKDKLTPNKKTGKEIIQYFKDNYPVTPLNNKDVPNST